jgi:hypothetical protein
VIRDAVPLKLVAGDTWRWTRSFGNYLAPTWVVTYYFENQNKQFSQAAVASSTAHALTIPAATSALLPAGRYRWFARATDGAVIETIDKENGWLDVLPDPAASGTRDQRSWARRALDAVMATIEGRATSDQQSFSIRDRTVSRMTYMELSQMKKDLEAQVRTEEAGAKAGLGRRLKVRFV